MAIYRKSVCNYQLPCFIAVEPPFKVFTCRPSYQPRTGLLIVVRKCLVTKKKTTAHNSLRPANYGKDHTQPAIGHSRGVDPSNPGMRLRHVKDSYRGFPPTPSDFNHPSTPSNDSDFRLNVSELEVNPRYLVDLRLIMMSLAAIKETPRFSGSRRHGPLVTISW